MALLLSACLCIDKVNKADILDNALHVAKVPLRAQELKADSVALHGHASYSSPLLLGSMTTRLS